MKNRNSHGRESTAEACSKSLFNVDLGNSAWRLSETLRGVRLGDLTDKIKQISLWGCLFPGTHMHRRSSVVDATEQRQSLWSGHASEEGQVA